MDTAREEKKTGGVEEEDVRSTPPEGQEPGQTREKERKIEPDTPVWFGDICQKKLGFFFQSVAVVIICKTYTFRRRRTT